MELQSIGSTIISMKDAGIQAGQRLLVEVLSRDISGKAQISIAGREITALLEIPVDQGEKFWVGVQSINEDGIILVREKRNNNHTIILPFSQNSFERMNLDLKQTLIAGGNPRVRDLLASFVQENIPEWASLGGKNGFKILAQLIKGLGFDYERRIRDIGNLPEEVQINEKNELSKTLKGILLLLLNGEYESEDKSMLSHFLERITGQQFWLMGTHTENLFYVFDFPLLYEGELLTQRLAVKASRKGNKVDLSHCRIALHAQTSTLGDIGIEGRLFEGQLALKVLGGDTEYLSRLVDENITQVREQLNQLGCILLSIDVAPLDTAEDFRRFIRGEQREGVDIHI